MSSSTNFDLSEHRNRSSWSTIDCRRPTVGKGVVGLNYLLKQRESVNFTQGVVVKTLLWWLSSFSLMLFNIIEKSHKMIANDECNCSATNLWVKKKKTNGISVAMEKKLIYLWDKLTLPKTTFIQYPFFTKRFPVHSTKKYLSVIDYWSQNLNTKSTETWLIIIVCFAKNYW